MNLKDSKTLQNLKDAFAGESMANRRYLYFARQADVEGQPDIAGLFGGVAEEAGDVRLPFDVGLAGEVEIAAVGHRLAGECVFQILEGLAVLEVHLTLSSLRPCLCHGQNFYRCLRRPCMTTW